ncbi:hypothetical protein VIGAN_09114800 [Vigna angularis var. angularis]|uniref:Uncharacterized protein n=1 Tax=Vigna angularis var. angularis TaxID=157739 RepID=A0A0S3SXK8_PHAAN|nr:hypothetical protein VIGAN_09114800 [Vigna angularis var. angularis]
MPNSFEVWYPFQAGLQVLLVRGFLPLRVAYRTLLGHELLLPTQLDRDKLLLDVLDGSCILCLLLHVWQLECKPRETKLLDFSSPSPLWP